MSRSDTVYCEWLRVAWIELAAPRTFRDIVVPTGQLRYVIMILNIESMLSPQWSLRPGVRL